MWVLRININNLKIDNRKLGMKTLSLFCDKMKLHSYKYFYKMNIVHRTTKLSNNKNFIIKFLEFQCDTLTTNQIKKFVKKMKTNGVSGESKIGLWDNNKLISKYDFNQGEELLNYSRKLSNYKYITRTFWKK